MEFKNLTATSISILGHLEIYPSIGPLCLFISLHKGICFAALISRVTYVRIRQLKVSIPIIDYRYGNIT